MSVQSRPTWLRKTKYCYDAKFCHTGGTGCCSYDYLRYQKWPRSWHNDNSDFSVILRLHNCSNISNTVNRGAGHDGVLLHGPGAPQGHPSCTSRPSSSSSTGLISIFWIIRRTRLYVCLVHLCGQLLRIEGYENQDKAWGQFTGPLWMWLWFYFDGLVQDCSNSSALAKEFLQSSAEPLIFIFLKCNLVIGILL